MQSLSTKAGKTIGVTGGIGCGKSTVLKYLKDMYDCVILPADDIAKKLEERGGECFAPLVALLTEEVLQQNGDLNKVRFAEMIFQNEELLNRKTDFRGKSKRS